MNDLAGHVAAGRAWFGRAVTRGAVLYVAAKRANVVRRRFAAFRRHHCLDDLPIAVVSGSVDLRSSGAGADAVIEQVGELQRIAGIPVVLVIIETANRVLCGGDENSPKDMGALVANLTYIGETTGAHVLVTHHNPADGAHRMRGHSLFLGACDTTVCVEKAGAYRTATVSKASDGPEDERLTFELKSVDLYTDETGHVTTAPVVVPVAADALPRPGSNATRKLPERLKIALDALRDCALDRATAQSTVSGLPTGQHAVPVTKWREEMTRRRVLDPEGANPRADFKRIWQSLQRRQLIGIRDDLCWLA